MQAEIQMDPPVPSAQDFLAHLKTLEAELHAAKAESGRWASLATAHLAAYDERCNFIAEMQKELDRLKAETAPKPQERRALRQTRLIRMVAPLLQDLVPGGEGVEIFIPDTEEHWPFRNSCDVYLRYHFPVDQFSITTDYNGTSVKCAVTPRA